MILFLLLIIIISLVFLFILRVLLMERKVLRKLAYIDKMTGLFNRNALDRFWAKYSGKGTLAALFLDLDHFKDINDTFGHQTGDLLLREVGQYLQQFNQQNMQVFRMGGDEFVIMMMNTNREEAEYLATRVLDKLSKPFVIQGCKVSIAGSIGISLSNKGKAKRAELLKEADMAMYQAKRLGKGSYSVYNEDKQSYYNEAELMYGQKRSANL